MLRTEKGGGDEVKYLRVVNKRIIMCTYFLRNTTGNLCSDDVFDKYSPCRKRGHEWPTDIEEKITALLGISIEIQKRDSGLKLT